jgi:hypothetical protein
MNFTSDPDIIKGVKIFENIIWPRILKDGIPNIQLRFPLSNVNEVFDKPFVSKGSTSDDPTKSEANFNIVLKRKDKQHPEENLDKVYLQNGLKMLQEKANKEYFNNKKVVNILESHPSHEYVPGGEMPDLFIPVIIDVNA